MRISRRKNLHNDESISLTFSFIFYRVKNEQLSSSIVMKFCEHGYLFKCIKLTRATGKLISLHLPRDLGYEFNYHIKPARETSIEMPTNSNERLYIFYPDIRQHLSYSTPKKSFKKKQ